MLEKNNIIYRKNKALIGIISEIYINIYIIIKGTRYLKEIYIYNIRFYLINIILLNIYLFFT